MLIAIFLHLSLRQSHLKLFLMHLVCTYIYNSDIKFNELNIFMINRQTIRRFYDKMKRIKKFDSSILCELKLTSAYSMCNTYLKIVTT